jgi:hypothetical protein
MRVRGAVFKAVIKRLSFVTVISAGQVNGFLGGGKGCGRKPEPCGKFE